MKWAPAKVQLYGQEDEFVVLDDFLYDLSPVTHPNGCNDYNFPPLICSASLFSLSRPLYMSLCYSGHTVPKLTFLSLILVLAFSLFLSIFLAFMFLPLSVSRFLPSSLFLKSHFHWTTTLASSLSFDTLSHFAPSHPHFPPFSLLHFLSLS